MKTKTIKKQNPFAKIVRSFRPSIVANKKGKGSYNRKKVETDVK